MCDWWIEWISTVLIVDALQFSAWDIFCSEQLQSHQCIWQHSDVIQSDLPTPWDNLLSLVHWTPCPVWVCSCIVGLNVCWHPAGHCIFSLQPGGKQLTLPAMIWPAGYYLLLHTTSTLPKPLMPWGHGGSIVKYFKHTKGWNKIVIFKFGLKSNLKHQWAGGTAVCIWNYQNEHM